jgi:cystathionine beta-lyase
MAEVTAYLDGNRHLLADFLGERLPGVELALPEATYLAWLDFRRLHLPDEPAPFVLERSRVALSDGRDFGAVGSGFARLNFATSREVLELALERIAATLTQCGSGSD